MEESQTASILEPEVILQTVAIQPREHVLEVDPWRFVKTFTPSWFTINMGTGIVSILLHNLPFDNRGLYWISVVIFAINVLLFVAFSIITLIRYLLYQGLWTAMIRHPVVPLFLGAIPMGLATIITMIVLVCVPAWGYWALIMAWVLWWIDAVLAVSVCYLVPFIIMHVHDSKLQAMTAVWLLPIAPPVVASAAGGVIAEAFATSNQKYALWTLITSYVLWGTAIPLSMTCLVLYFHRLTMHNLPPREVVISSFLPVAPLGEGAYAIFQFGKVSSQLFPETKTLGAFSDGASSGHTLYVLGWLVCLIMWAYGLAWLFFAIISIIKYRRIPFNIGWWGLTFPMGVWTSATLSLGNEMSSTFFSYLGTAMSCVVALLWLLVTVFTLRGAFTGRIFVAPDFDNWRASESTTDKVNSNV
ncbi:sulfite transporter Ssu1 [Pochonia chlamydosporia 170]|uniref:Sulfite efflux pump SSU1 n=1 Tax=Pochonia chlamydosporia 170 TaxID=1380566 RepID=A0A179F6L0_METCM|nr:sulfite transporter Ssu1 [Pochonia chlamydosporia 170]OAQ61096.2 sulfite transporter Ssu1 [Pochonia chlamydosporia 170]